MEGRMMTNGTKPNWQQTVEQYRAEAKRLQEKAQALSECATQEDAIRSMEAHRQARQLARRATQVEAYYLYGEIVQLD
jgi:hypothetical protein